VVTDLTKIGLLAEEAIALGVLIEVESKMVLIESIFVYETDPNAPLQ
jgi:hypothetical protein